jgi:hypothetical protein
MLTRRRVTTAVIVAATGGVATVAMAAGPVVYSEYTTGGDRENRVVQGDGSGDTGLPIDVTGATVSPDGRRIAQTTLLSSPTSSRLASSLRVTAGDGSGATTVLSEGPGRGGDSPGRIVSGTPVWSPDSTQVIVQRTTVRDGEPAADGTRVICQVDARACRDAGRANPIGARDSAALRGDVVAWQATDGPIVRDALRGGELPTRIRCGAGATTVKGPSMRLAGLPGSSFGAPIALRGLATPDGRTPRLADGTVGALATPAGTLLVDAPQATLRRGALRCGGREARASFSTSLGVARVRLRAGGRTTTLPVPPGLRRGQGLRLVGTDDGGAVLISAPPVAERGQVYCFGGGSRRVRDCPPDDRYFSGSGESGRDGVLRVWRLVAGPAPHFDRVTTARRSALRTLAGASELTVADGNAVLAVSDGAIERVPLDGGAPTPIARGRELSLDVSAW